MSFYIKLLPLILTIFGSLTIILIHYYNSILYKLYIIDTNWFDFLYSYYFIYPIFNYAYYCFKLLDKGFIEFLGPSGLVKSSFFYSSLLSKTDSGVISHYTLNIILAFILIGIWIQSAF
jgi:NADH-ubiquinone oxidoreductase chain 5